ncbi:MAG: tetratricopeptide repeat protein [Bryobacter sp.]|nr:tetratricopeptide repeat protein [Bryobacter sp.]
MLRRLAYFFVLLCCASRGLSGQDTWLVLPPVNETGDASLEWVGESVVEQFFAVLTQRGELVVSRDARREAESRLALRPYAPWTLASTIKLGEALDAHWILTGSYQNQASAGAGMGRMSLTLQVVSLREFQHVKVPVVEGALETLASLEVKAAWRALQASGMGGLPPEEDFLASFPPADVRALEAHVRGILATDEKVRQTYFEKALTADPAYGPAAYQLGRVLYNQEDYAAAGRTLARVRKNDRNYWQAQFLAGLAHSETGNFLAAAKAFETVYKELPLPEVSNNWAGAQFRARSGEAKETMLRTLDGDDRDPHYHFNLGLVLMGEGQWILAAEQFRAALARLPEDEEATKMLGKCLRPPARVEDQQRSEWGELFRLKTELNEFAFRQLQMLLNRKLENL